MRTPRPSNFCPPPGRRLPPSQGRAILSPAVSPQRSTRLAASPNPESSGPACALGGQQVSERVGTRRGPEGRRYRRRGATRGDKRRERESKRDVQGAGRDGQDKRRPWGCQAVLSGELLSATQHWLHSFLMPRLWVGQRPVAEVKRFGKDWRKDTAPGQDRATGKPGTLCCAHRLSTGVQWATAAPKHRALPGEEWSPYISPQVRFIPEKAKSPTISSP